MIVDSSIVDRANLRVLGNRIPRKTTGTMTMSVATYAGLQSMYPLKVVILKPSKYMIDGTFERFHRGVMPNSTVPHIRSMVPADLDGQSTETWAIDECVHTDLEYLNLIKKDRNSRALLVLVGVQAPRGSPLSAPRTKSPPSVSLKYQAQ